MDLAVLVQNIKIQCKAKGITPTVACRESGAGANFIQNAEKGSAPSITKVQQLAVYLSCTVSDLLGEEKSAPAIREDDKDALDRELISRLVELTPEELEKVDAFVQGLLAARR